MTPRDEALADGVARAVETFRHALGLLLPGAKVEIRIRAQPKADALQVSYSFNATCPPPGKAEGSK